MLTWTLSDIIMIEPRIMWSVRLLNSSDYDTGEAPGPGQLPIVFPRDNDSLVTGHTDHGVQATSEALLESLFLGLERSNTFLSFSAGRPRSKPATALPLGRGGGASFRVLVLWPKAGGGGGVGTGDPACR